MKIKSASLTALLIIPLVLSLSSAGISVEPGFHTPVITIIAWQSISVELIYFIFWVVAICFHFKKMYRENTVMCTTLISAYLLFVILQGAFHLFFHD